MAKINSWKRWTPEEIHWLRENGPKMSLEQLSEVLGRTKDSVHARCFSLKVLVAIPKENEKYRFRRLGHHWTDEEIQILKDCLGKMHVRDIAAKLNKTERAISMKALALGIPTAFRFRRWTKAETFILLEESEKGNAKLIAKKLNRSVEAIENKMNRSKILTFNGINSLNRAIKKTGYDRKQLERARDALNQYWKRVPWGSHSAKIRFLITDVQLEACCEWLRDALRGRMALPRRTA